MQNTERLRDEGVLVPDFAEIRILEAKQNCSDINVSAVHHLTAAELMEGRQIEKELIAKRSAYLSHDAVTPTPAEVQGETTKDK